MKLNEFKTWFADFAAGIPFEGVNSAQWRKLQAVVDTLEVEAVKVPVEKKTAVKE